MASFHFKHRQTFLLLRNFYVLFHLPFRVSTLKQALQPCLWSAANSYVSVRVATLTATKKSLYNLRRETDREAEEKKVRRLFSLRAWSILVVALMICCRRMIRLGYSCRVDTDGGDEEGGWRGKGVWYMGHKYINLSSQSVRNTRRLGFSW